MSTRLNRRDDKTRNEHVCSVVAKPKTLSIMLTFTCTAACENCGTLSSPKSRENISAENAMRYMDEAKGMAFEVVVFTGGEATLRWKDLLRCISYSRMIGLKNRLVTNAYWATTEAIAEEKITALCSAGLDEINFSTGDEHVRYVPLDRVTLAAKVSIRKNLHTCIMVEVKTPACISRRDILESGHISQLPEEVRRKLAILESPWMSLRPDEHYEYPEQYRMNSASAVKYGGCDSLLSTYTVQADGRIGACCGLGMRNIGELNAGMVGGALKDAMAAAESDWIKLAIHYLGAPKLLQFAAQKDPTIKWENMYAHHCQACSRLYGDNKIRAAILNNFSEIQRKVKEAMIIDEGLMSPFSQAATGEVVFPQ